MAKEDFRESPLFWPAHFKGNVLNILDETLIPDKVTYIPVKNLDQAVRVIRDMKTRAFGQFLVVLNTFLLIIAQHQKSSPQKLLEEIKKAADALNNSRPTFPFSEVTSVVVHWAQKALEQGADMTTYLQQHIQGYLHGIRAKRLERVRKIATLIKDGDSVLTHCNVSGELAMAAAICLKEKKEIHFFATETRPYLQGLKLTAWELNQLGAEVTVIPDNAVGSVMSDGLVNKVIVGSDRSCANGDFANKIGTYQIAVLAQEFGLPFYVLTQPSTKVPSGDHIPIEVRDENELLKYAGKNIVGKGVGGFYPGFDVIPHELVTETVPIDVR